VRLTKLENDDKSLEHRFFVSGVRAGLDSKSCPYLIKYNEEGIIEWNSNLYHCVKYDDPCTNLREWIVNDHQDLQIKQLEVYRILLSGLRCFDFLEKNDYVLT